LKAKPGNRIVRMTWSNPKAPDFDRIEITRSGSDPGAPGTVLYRGAATSFADRAVRNDVEYRYLFVAFDHTGNASGGVVVLATPKRPLLVSPPDGAKLKNPPELDWVASATARYYNVQIFRGGVKILSAWPKKNSFKLKRKWRFNRSLRRLTPGTYVWFVWPGLGERKEGRYGPVLGSSTFRIVG